MKQLLCIALATVIVGCTKEVDDESKASDNNIGFTTQVDTRGASVTTETISNFGVFGYGTLDKSWTEAQSEAIPDLFDNIEVLRQGTTPPYTWDYTGDVNWNGGLLAKYTFFGYSPRATADNGITAPLAGTKDVPKISFEALDIVRSQIDLLSAQAIDIVSSADPVLMKFGHALSRIGFKAYSETANIAVKSIEITGVKYKGDLTLYNSSWFSSTDTKTFTLTYLAPVSLAAEAKDDATATDISVGSGVNGYFMLLPQSLTGNATSKIIFHYTVDGKDVPAKEYVIKELWEKGKAITYTVDLTTNMEADLKVTDVTITDWAMGANEVGNGDGSVSMVTLTYNDVGAVVGTEEVIQNGELSISKRPANPIQTWNTKADGSGEYYGNGDVIILDKNITLYNVDNTVTIGGMRWLRGNLSGMAGSSTGYYTEGNPIGSGMFFKWGDTWVYQRESSTTDGLQGDRSFNASKEPQISSTNKLGYDYIGLSGGRASGDPCKELGENFMTPTSAQFATLIASGERRNASYRGVIGVFLGAKAAECNDTKIVEECIFLPYTGVRSPVGDLSGVGVIANYWTSTANDYTTDGNFFTANAGLIRASDPAARGAGLSVRCVSTDVNVGGVNWTTSNLEGTVASAKGHRMASTPQAYGHFFKWGDMWVYQRESSTTDLMKGNNIDRAATIPGRSLGSVSEEYDYGKGLSGGPAPGDPCRMLGKAYRTPTYAESKKLSNLPCVKGYYKGVLGVFYGAKAAECSNDKIAEDCVFFPIGGIRGVDGMLGNLHIGYYWLSSTMSNSSRALLLGVGLYLGENGARACGYSVRCVRDDI